MTTKRTFAPSELLLLGLPYEAPEGGAIVSDRIVAHRRWSVVHELIFRLPGQPEGEAWRTTYSVGATE